MPNKDSVTIIDNRTGKEIELNLLKPTKGPMTIDIQSLYKELGYFTYDPAFMATASCRSNITYLDGDKGVLEYRGYPIEQLAEESTFLETCYLLLNGELPNKTELEEFTNIIAKRSMLHEQMITLFSGFRRDAHPMAIMEGVVGALSAFYHDDEDVHDAEDRMDAGHRLIAKIPTIAAWSYRYAKGMPFVQPRADLGYSENFLHMMFSMPSEEYKVDPVMAKALDIILILHADHEQNASTSTVRLAGSSQANPFSVMSAGIASLWGPAHGGANEAVIRMLTEINESGRPLSEFIDRAKDPDDRFRLMGFGHRVYKNYDPRAKIIREICYEMLENNPVSDPKHQLLLDTAMELEKVALSDEFFKSRNLYPNVDFYSGIIFLGMGIPLNMFTVLFTLGRTVGWVSQWSEMMGDPKTKIGRPRQLYLGEDTRYYKKIDER